MQLLGQRACLLSSR